MKLFWSHYLIAVNWNFCNIYLTWWRNWKCFINSIPTNILTHTFRGKNIFRFSRFPQYELSLPFVLGIFFHNSVICGLLFFVDMIMYKCKIFYWFAPNFPLLGNWYLPDLSPKRKIEMNTLKLLWWYGRRAIYKKA